MSKILVLFVMSAVLSLMSPFAALSSSSGGGGKVTPAMLAQGKSVYEKACMACHETGAAGAPKLGDKAAWKEPVARGLNRLAEVAIRGKGAMPPRGGNPALSDAEMRAAVAYMMENSR
jgi:cytochrome c5